jgi:hypothetical protein
MRLLFVGAAFGATVRCPPNLLIFKEKLEDRAISQSIEPWSRARSDEAVLPRSDDPVAHNAVPVSVILTPLRELRGTGKVGNRAAILEG